MEAHAKLFEERGVVLHNIHAGGEQVEADDQDRWRVDSICKEPTTARCVPGLSAYLRLPCEVCDARGGKEVETDCYGVKHNVGLEERRLEEVVLVIGERQARLCCGGVAALAIGFEHLCSGQDPK